MEETTTGLMDPEVRDETPEQFPADTERLEPPTADCDRDTATVVEPPDDPIAQGISTLKDTIASVSIELADAQAMAKRLKRRLKDAIEELAELQARDEQAAENDAQRPLLRQDEDSVDDSVEAADGWQAVPIWKLKLKPRTQKALEEAGLETLGKIQDHVNQQGDWWWKMIAGIGAKAADEIADAFASFFADHPEHCQPAADEVCFDEAEPELATAEA